MSQRPSPSLKRLRAWYVVHKWTSLVSTLFLFLICLTGLPLVFSDEIDHALSDTSIYLRDAARATELAAKREKAQSRLDKAEAEWMAAAEAFDAAVSGV